MKTIQVPESFIWVIEQWKLWHENCNNTGEFKIIYKSGGICGVQKNEYLKPPKK